MRLGPAGGVICRRGIRGDGNRPSAAMDSAAGGTLLCPEHLALAESRDPQMGARGFWVRGGADPLQEPVLLHGAAGRQVVAWLAADGRYLFEAPVPGAGP